MVRSIPFSLELISPLFLGSAQASSPADAVRASAVRGQLRYWLRALLGREHQDVQDLLKNESRLLGSTGCSSPVWIRCDSSHAGIQANYDLLPHRSDPRARSSSKAFAPKQPISVSLLARPGLRDIPPKVIAALLLWIHLGGLGKRARRGMGSLQMIAPLPPLDLPLPPLPVPDGAGLAQHLSVLLARCLDLFPSGTKGTAHRPQFPCLVERHANVLVCQHAFPDSSFAPYEEALRRFWLDALRDKDFRDERAYGYTQGKGRRASPFHLHLSRSQAGYHLVLTSFWSSPDPAGENGWKRLESLLQHCRKKWDGIVVWGKQL